MLFFFFVGAGEKDERSANSDPTVAHFPDLSLKKCVNEYMNFYFQLIKDVSTLGRCAAGR